MYHVMLRSQIQLSTTFVFSYSEPTYLPGQRHHREIHGSKEVGLEVNTEKTRYMLLSRHQNAGQNHDIKIANICFENVA
jgi:hypothetical protein